MTSHEDQSQAESVRLAKVIAAAEDQVAQTMDTLAKQLPHQEEHLQALGDDARKQAARQRQWAEDHREGNTPVAQD
jgi:uncharacterized iron-regulated protein